MTKHRPAPTRLRRFRDGLVIGLAFAATLVGGIWVSQKIHAAVSAASGATIDRLPPELASERMYRMK